MTGNNQQDDNTGDAPKAVIRPQDDETFAPKVGIYPLFGVVMLCVGVIVYGVFFRQAPTAPPPLTPAGATAPGSLGISVNPEPRGVVVLSTRPGSPAAQAGLKQGDLIINIDGMAARGGLTAAEFSDRLKGQAGTKVTITYIREDQDAVQVTLTREAPQSTGKEEKQ